MMAPAASPPKKAPPRPQRASAVVGGGIAPPAIATPARAVRAFRLTSPHAVNSKTQSNSDAAPKGRNREGRAVRRADRAAALGSPRPAHHDGALQDRRAGREDRLRSIQGTVLPKSSIRIPPAAPDRRAHAGQQRASTAGHADLTWLDERA